MAKLLKQLKSEVKDEIVGLFLLAVAVLTYTALRARPTGIFGSLAIRLISSLLGRLSDAFPIIIAFGGLAAMVRKTKIFSTSRLTGTGLLLIVAAGYCHLPIQPSLEFGAGLRGMGGGLLGAFSLWVLRKLFGETGTIIVLVTAAVVGLLLFTDASLVLSLLKIKKRLVVFLRGAKKEIADFIFAPAGNSSRNKLSRRPSSPVRPEVTYEYDWKEENDAAATAPDFPVVTAPVNPAAIGPAGTSLAQPALSESKSAVTAAAKKNVSEYQLPPFTILRGLRVVRGNRGQKGTADKSQLLEETLASFGVQAKVVDVSRGPAVTRYELQPAPGLRVNKVLSLADDIALSMAAVDVRIEAPIPGKAAIGIEVPNDEIAMVPLREVLEAPEFAAAKAKLAVALGKDIAGVPILSDLGKMVHVLVAGATGSGKSVCINTLIASILFKAKPDEVKFLLVDPKVVELSNYNSIPHLLAPVVTDPRKAAGALKWVVQEMENRYSLFAAAGVRDITKFNNLARRSGDSSEDGPAPLPFIVVIIDELADLMMVSAVDVEDAICRLAQMARAAGIHLVVATQRPSVDVVTGLIKANIPSRIAFAVSSQVDSRTILDMNGAEKLLGRGDMLYLPSGAAKPLRVQGAFISEKEVEALVSFWRQQETTASEEITFQMAEKCEETTEFTDELFDKAVELILTSNQASISLLQRRLHIGYTRAARLIDMMEDKGIVGRHEGSKPREILTSREQWYRQKE